MNNLYIQATKSTPEIDFNHETNRLIIKGESYPENSFKFYEPIFEWIEEFIKQVDSKVTVEISLIYLNTSSTKSIMNLLDILEECHSNGKDIVVNWYYDPENELSYEIALDFKDYLEIEFNIISQ